LTNKEKFYIFVLFFEKHAEVVK